MNPTTLWRPAHLDAAAPLRDDREVHLWLMDLDDPPWPLDELAADLDADEAARAARFHFDRDGRRWRAARALLRRVLARYAGTPARELRFELGAAGKPALANPATTHAPSFNLSHSGGHAVLGVARGPRIGVDIEVMRPMSDRDAIARSHFALAEQLALSALPPPLQDDGFFACWTRKEAYVKALGGGLSIPLADFEVSVDPRKPAALEAAIGGPAEAARWTIWSTRPQPGVWASAAIELDPGQMHISALRLT